MSRKYLAELAKMFIESPRHGNEKDNPIGSRYIMLSDTLAGKICRQLRTVASGDNVTDSVYGYCIYVVNILASEPRYGNTRDDPEGSRYLRISETTLRKMEAKLQAASLNWKP
jgi:hypothetical protein